MHSVVLNYDPWQYITVENLLPPDRREEIQNLARSEMEAYHNSNELTISGNQIVYDEQNYNFGGNWNVGLPGFQSTK